MAMEPQDIQPLTKLTPPKPAIRNSKNIMVSFHFPEEILRKPECIPNPTEWFVELRHFFVDLPQQLGQLEEFSMMTANAGTTTENDEDRAKDGKWLIGRWMVVAYVFASTPEALQQLDWCQLICSDIMADLHAYSAGPEKLEVTYSAQWTKIYRLDRKPTASSEHACQYGEITGASESEETEAEGILDTQMVPTAYHMVPTGSPYGPSHMRYAPVPPGVAIPPELKDRCHLIDRTWPSLMAGGASIPDTTLDKEWDMI
ncbi:hypothetical protein QBC32DRAFT_373050 [Pseudoneurospora amorphoporcata]|uniref:Uncharacterized protein n=1 Tax=Pseudoneurospora amorphoporcata TaxID=241081 RepID=A0AAN6NNU8_9PEZI|nr:hypothetical protein QBC32DRAFT_373050 [Pseudoneurospora amorphoporcata]